MNHEPKAGMNLDPEMIAAYIDKRLTPEQRAAVEAQLAKDPDSYAVLVESLKAIDEMSVPEVRTVPFVPKGKVPTVRRWTIAAGVLAAAAALVLVVMQPQWLQRLRGDRVDPQLEKLVAAVGPERYFEARLAGGFTYGPLRTVTRGPAGAASQNLALLAAAGELQKKITSSSSPSDLHAWGIAQLLTADYDGAVRTLQEAALQGPSEPSFQSDLSGALLARASATDRPEDLAPALAAADRALRLDPSLLEAKFNRALSLDALHLDEQASDAWQAYLTSDATSDWAAEARQRLQRLSNKPKASSWSPGDPITVSNAFRAREWLFNVELPEWARTIASNNHDQTTNARIIEAAKALSALTSDRTFDVIAADVTVVDPSRRLVLAQSYAQFASATEAVRADQLKQISEYSRTACRSFAAAGSAFQSACEVERASALLQERDFDGLRRELDRLRPIVATDAFLYSQARIRWLDGMVMMVAGQLGAAATPYAEARRIFESIGEWPSAARMWSQESEAMYWSGAYRDSWHSRSRALELAAVVRDPTVSRSVHASVAAVLQNDGLPGPASVFAQASAHPWGVSLPPLMQLFPLQRALLSAVDANDLESAQRSREQIERIVGGNGDPRVNAMAGDVKVAFAALEAARGDTAIAELHLSEAIDAMGVERQLAGRVWAQLARAEIRLRLGDDVDARSDLEQVIDRLMTRSGPAVNIRMADAGRLRRAAARLALNSGTADEETLRLYDRARSVLDADDASSSSDLQGQIRGLGPETAVIAMVDDGTRVGAWVVSQSHVVFTPFTLSSDEVKRLCSLLAFLADRSSGGSSQWDKALRSLYGALFAPVAPELAGMTRVVVVADGVLRGVPFGALIDDAGRSASEKWTIELASTFAAAAARTEALAPGPRMVLIVGDPRVPSASAMPLPGARREAAAIAEIYSDQSSPTLLLGDRATRENVLRSLPAASIVHFALHAVTNNSNPGQAFLQLASEPDRPDGRWRVEELRPGSFRASQIVILAACQTADGSIDPQESVNSFASAIIRAGAGAVIASLWPLPDGDSAELFAAIHRGLRSGLPAGEALRAAQRNFLRTHSTPTAIAAVSGLQAFRTGPHSRRKPSESESE